jgi:hypothetical protein
MVKPVDKTGLNSSQTALLDLFTCPIMNKKGASKDSIAINRMVMSNSAILGSCIVAGSVIC